MCIAFHRCREGHNDKNIKRDTKDAIDLSSNTIINDHGSLSTYGREIDANASLKEAEGPEGDGFAFQQDREEEGDRRAGAGEGKEHRRGEEFSDGGEWRGRGCG